MKKMLADLIRYGYKLYLCWFRHIIIKHGASISFDCTFEGKHVINQRALLRNISLGYATYVGNACILLNADIGRYCSIADRVEIITGTHPVSSFVSTHPAFFSTLKQSGFTYVKENRFEEFRYTDKKRNKIVTIGNDVWIGYGAKILQGVKIGDGAVIGACSLVTKDVEPFTIVAGIPAKKIKKRFAKDEEAFLNQLQWWNKDQEFINEHLHAFSDIKQFMKECKGGDNA